MRRVALFLLLAGLLASGQGWLNNYDEPLSYHCRPGQSISSIKSMHHNYYEDRQWDLGCKDSSISTECFLSHYVNNFDQEFTFQCPTNYVIAGMHSFHHNYYEDRRWQFYCCKSKCEVSSNCQWTSYVNDFDETFHWYVPYHQVLVGAGSYHHNYYRSAMEVQVLCAKIMLTRLGILS
ncbi:hemagglutinin/amebocyte aggregation factor-like isoform X2 [Megalobrama amblycephala]|uniref:hemagglutinin/amebocyte aggregation factor-like isoform X2 n=1 Tax=Megalobrama amblycephala TaxID=75352 RepID=UPI00201441A7|nr:hemagglutinin/amebocyte aggregation factor-like isoform X2 [Megalobrama amblycephala]